MLKNLRTSTWFLCGTILGLSLAIGHSVLATKDSEQIPFEDLQAFTEIFSKVKSDYVEQVDEKKLIEDAIRGMLNGLDPHSAYLNTSEFSDLKIGTTGQSRAACPKQAVGRALEFCRTTVDDFLARADQHDEEPAEQTTEAPADDAGAEEEADEKLEAKPKRGRSKTAASSRL